MIEREILISTLLNEGTIQATANKLNCSPVTVYNHMNEAGLMLCRGCDDIEIIELIKECIEAHTPYTVENNLDY